MPPVMHRDEAILMPWVNICEAYCQYLHNTTTRNRDCWLGKLRRETARCWWRRRLESGECLMITFLGAAHQMTRWIPPERCDHFCFYTEASSPTFSWVAEQDHLPHDNLTVSITLWISLIRKVLEDKKSHNFQALTFLTPMCVVSSFSVSGTCDCEARHVDGLFREWWPSDDCFSDSRSRGTGQESRQATQCANKQS